MCLCARGIGACAKWRSSIGFLLAVWETFKRERSGETEDRGKGLVVETSRAPCAREGFGLRRAYAIKHRDASLTG